MQTTTQGLSSKMSVYAATESIKKLSNKNIIKPSESSPAKDNSLELLLASCCDCV
jgi:hypothetical protein